MRVTFKLDQAQADKVLDPIFGLSKEQGYTVKPLSLMMSALLHVLLVLVMFLAPGRDVSERRAKDEEPVKADKVVKLIWLNPKSDLPDLASPEPKKMRTTGATQSRRILIADSRQGSKTEFVWQPSPAELPKTITAPNIISLKAAVPAPPAPTLPSAANPDSAKALRIFVAPVSSTAPVPRSAVAAPALLPAPAVLVQRAPVALPMAPALQPDLPAPPAIVSASKGPEHLIPLPRFPSPAKPGASARIPSGDLSAPPNLEGVGNRNIASINLNSLATPNAIPPGSRAGQFSSAPATSNTTGSSETRGASVPGLTARGRPGGEGTRIPEPRTSVPPPPPTAVAYRDIMSHAIGSSVSAPLRPGSRTIPLSIEDKFHDHVIYTLVLPSPRLPEYADDWILWFSEPSGATGSLATIRSPIPEKKRMLQLPENQTWGVVANILIAAVIDETGHVRSASVLRASPGFPSDFAVADLNCWEFRPATRNGVPIAVEALIDIPFRRPIGRP